MSLLEELKELGTDIDDGLERVMGDTSLYEMMLGMFLSSVEENPISPAEFDEADLEPLIKKVHSLKGITGNLALTPLFNSYTEILGLLRGKEAEKARAGFEGLQPVQAKMIECIQRHQGE